MVSISLFGAVILTCLVVVSVLWCRWSDKVENGKVQLLAWPVGIGLAFLIGAAVYSGHPRWPLTSENEDRFLAILLPLAVMTEVVAFFLPGWVAWTGRLLISLSATPLLLLGTVYFQTWSGLQTTLWLGILATCLMLAWVSLDCQIRLLPPRTVLFGLAGVNAGAGIVLMIGGYATGGPLAMILGAALATTALVSPRTLPAKALAGAASIGLVGLFAILVSGHFLASLGLDHAAILFAAPVLAWVLILPRIRKAAMLRVAVLVLEALPVVGVVGLAWKRSEEPETRTSVNDTTDYSPADYEQFGK